MLNKRNIFFLFLGLACVWIATGNETIQCRETPDGRKLPIALYYESLCPDCQFFATKQLKPIYEEIKNHVEMLLVPFGKSESENGGEAFFCQHGPAECMGNEIQSCVLDAINYEQDASVRFLDCQMQPNADFSGKECALSVNVTYETLLACQTGPKGTELQLIAENQTHIVARPYPPFVPFVVYNRKLNRDQQRRSEREFGKVVCEQLANIYCENAMPSVCRTTSESSAAPSQNQL